MTDRHLLTNGKRTFGETMRERSTTGVERVPPSKNLGVATNCRVAHRSRGGPAVDVTGSAGRLKMRLPKKAYRIVKGRLLPAWSLASVRLLIRFCRLLPCCQQVNPPRQGLIRQRYFKHRSFRGGVPHAIGPGAGSLGHLAPSLGLALLRHCAVANGRSGQAVSTD